MHRFFVETGRAVRGAWPVPFLAAVALTLPLYAMAGEEGAETVIDWGPLIMGLMGGLALFLFGMDMMSEGLKKGAGSRMRNILGMLTKNRVIGLFVGAVVTMVIQSSSATTVMLVGFVQAELMSFAQSLGVILGADIGTTITAQLIAFKLTKYALGMIGLGFAMRMFAQRDSFRHAGEVLLGFGILFFGMHLMSEVMVPIRTYQPFIDLLAALENPLLGILVGAAFTALIQSSSAFTGIVIVLASQGALTLEAGIPLIMGANIGTCITAVLASLKTSRAAKRVALAHVLFKVLGVLLFVFWIGPFASLVNWVSGDADMPRMVANAHTIFNVGFAIVFLPFTHLVARLVERLLPDLPVDRMRIFKVRHIHPSHLETPAIAIDLTRAEIGRMARNLLEMLDLAIQPFLFPELERDPEFPDLSVVQGIQFRESKIDFLDQKVQDFLIRLSRKPLSRVQADEVIGYLSMASDFEAIADIISKNMLPLIAKKRVLESDFSVEGQEEIGLFHVKVMKQLSRLNEILDLPERRYARAQRVIEKERKYDVLEAELRLHHLQRCRDERTGTLETHEIHMELMDLLKRINVYAGNIARTVIQMSQSSQAS
jgi:phosphate:Na+ symporter